METANHEQYCTFMVDEMVLGVNVTKIQEVIRYQEMTRIPLAPPAIRGMVNLRGQIVTAIDLRRRLDLPERPKDELPMNVVIRTKDGPISLLVDEIGDVQDVEAGRFEAPPETLRGAARSLIEGVFELDSGLMLVLDTEKCVDPDILWGRN